MNTDFYYLVNSFVSFVPFVVFSPHLRILG